MVYLEDLGLFAGAIALGAVHGLEPGHGWPVAASYALDRTNKWLYGFVASFIIGVGHLVSSLAMVAAFFYAKSYFNLTQVNEPIVLFGTLRIGGPVSLVAGVVLVALGIREYVHGHGSHPHDHGDEHDHEDEHGHSHDHSEESRFGRFTARIPFLGAPGRSHDAPDDSGDRGLLGIAWFAFVLGFAHEEEFEIIALCAGSPYCLELMTAYAVTVVLGIVGLTMSLIAGYERSEERVERYTPYLPVFSAVVLVFMGLGFVVGLF